MTNTSNAGSVANYDTQPGNAVSYSTAAEPTWVPHTRSTIAEK